MNEAYPDDADGDALRRIASTGADMSRPMQIDFFVAVPGIIFSSFAVSLIALASVSYDRI